MNKLIDTVVVALLLCCVSAPIAYYTVVSVPEVTQTIKGDY